MERRQSSRRINRAIPKSNLTGRDLSDLNLCGKNFRGVDLTDADLSYSILNGLDLRNTILKNTNLIGADLSWTDFAGADLTGADLMDANLAEADLRYAKNLCCEQLQGAIINKKTLLPNNMGVTWVTATQFEIKKVPEVSIVYEPS